MKTQVIIPFRDRGIDPRRGANLDDSDAHSPHLQVTRISGKPGKNQQPAESCGDSGSQHRQRSSPCKRSNDFTGRRS